jgi:exodeoxyribonuclease V gamma subunit
MFHVHRSNRLERLADALVAEVAANPLGSPMAPEWIAVQSLGARAFLEGEIAAQTGVFANVEMPLPSDLFHRAIRWALGEDAEAPEILSEDRLALAILDTLPGLMGRRELAPVKRYVERGDADKALHALSRKIAHAFAEYALYRPALVSSWIDGAAGDGWQPILFRAATARLEAAAGRRPTTQAELAREAVAALERAADTSLPGRVSLFGVTSLPPLHVELLAALARRTEVHLFALNPSREYTGDSGRTDGNRLVASMGRLGRDFQHVLEERVQYVEGPEELFVDPAPEGRGSVLASIQSDMLHLRRRGGQRGADAPTLSRDPSDWSIKVCACRSPLREIEAVRDEILALFAAPTSTFLPEDVAVLAPSIEAYAPFIEAVFGGAPEIPRSLARGPSEGPASLLDAASALLALTEARLDASELFGFLARPPVARRFGLTAAALDDLLSASLDAGARFGIDADHRHRLGLPRLADNTWRFALDRVLVGLAMSPKNGRPWRGVLPWDGGSADPSGAIGLVACLTEVIGAIEAMAAPRPLSAWCDGVREVVRAVCDVDGEPQPSRDAFMGALAALEEDVARSGGTAAVGPSVFALELLARASEAPSRRTPTGGVICSDLSRMRGVPYRAIFVVGLGGRAFPRSPNPPGFDLMAAAPRPGDRSPRDEDQALFLEAILAARDRLVVTFSAEGDRGGKEPPSAVVAQLLDAIEEGFEADVLVAHPVEPFSPAYFTESRAERDRMPGFGRAAFAAASARAGGGGPAIVLPCEMAPLPLAERDVAALDLADLATYFGDPSAYFCRRVLGIVPPRSEGEVPEREPFELDALARYDTGSMALRALLEGEAPEAVYDRAAGTGRIPVGAYGAIKVAEESGKALAIAETVRRAVGDGAARGTDSVPFEMDVETPSGPCALRGLVDSLTPSARLVTDFGKVNGKRLLQAWIPHLALCCLDANAAARSSCFFSGERGKGPVCYELGAVEDARALLSRLVGIYWEGQRRPLALFPKSSYAYAAAVLVPARKAKKPANAADVALSKAKGEWDGGFGADAPPGERDAEAVRILFGGARPWELDDGGPFGFRKLALEIFGPLLTQTGEGRA